MEIRKELTPEELNQVIGGADYTVQWNETDQCYDIFDAAGEMISTQGTILTRHGLEAFMDEHPEDTFKML